MTEVAIITLLIGAIARLFPCSCFDPGSVKEAYNHTETIIHGKVLNKSFVSFEEAMEQTKVDSLKSALKEDSHKLELLETDFIIKIEFEAIKVFKGNLSSDTTTIFTSRTSASCGFLQFEEGREFIVYGSAKSHVFYSFGSLASNRQLEKENTYWTNHCTRTWLYHEVEAKELELLSEK